MQINQQRIQEATALAQEAFWTAIAKAFPEAKSGDFPPDATAAFAAACDEAATTWVRGNASATAVPASDTVNECANNSARVFSAGLDVHMDLMLNISTANIPQHTAKALGNSGDPTEGIELWSLLSYVHWHDYGWIIYCGASYTDNIREKHRELANLMDFCVARKICYLKLDCDAVKLDGFPEFSW